MYALNVSDGAVIWKTHLGTPMSGAQLPCGNINPSGITGTPVVDLESRTIYLIAFEQPGVHRLYSVNILNGHVANSWNADPPGASPLVEQQRGALALLSNTVYIPYGGLAGDCGDYHGYIVGIPTSGADSVISFQATRSREGGIWAPSGIVVYNGDLLVTTGNDASTSNFDYGNSVLLLSPSLHLLDFFAPANWASLNEQDEDLGSTSPVVLGPGLIFQVGKEGVGYMINSTHFGGVGGQIVRTDVCRGAFGGTAYLYPYVYVACSDGLYALLVQLGGSPSFSTVWHEGGDYGPPIISGGYVWAVNFGTGQLTAFDPGNGIRHFSVNLSGTVHFETPSAGDGMVFAASGTSIIAVSLA